MYLSKDDIMLCAVVQEINHQRQRANTAEAAIAEANSMLVDIQDEQDFQKRQMQYAKNSSHSSNYVKNKPLQQTVKQLCVSALISYGMGLFVSYLP